MSGNGPTPCLEGLPLEVLELILSWTPVPSALQAASTGPALYQAFNSDLHWTLRCVVEFNINPSDYPEFDCKSPYLLYTKFLYYFRGCFGLWRRTDLVYGNLHQWVWSKADSGFVLFEWLPPPDMTPDQPCRKKKILVVTPDANGEQIITPLDHILQGEVEEEDMKLELMGNGDIINVTAMGVAEHHHTDPWYEEHRDKFVSNLLGRQYSHVRQEAYEARMTPEVPVRLDMYPMVAASLADRRFKENLDRRHCAIYQRLLSPLSDTSIFSRKLPIQPGLFTGTYGSHGLEFLTFSYCCCLVGDPVVNIPEPCNCDTPDMFVGIKTTGDPNVPFSRLTFQGYYDKTLELNKEQQETIKELLKAESQNRPWDESSPPQPYRLPGKCFGVWRGAGNMPGQRAPANCIARFMCDCLIAGDGFQSPEYINGHLAVLSPDLFAIIWLQMDVVAFYHRVKDEVLGATWVKEVDDVGQE